MTIKSFKIFESSFDFSDESENTKNGILNIIEDISDDLIVMDISNKIMNDYKIYLYILNQIPPELNFRKIIYTGVGSLFYRFFLSLIKNKVYYVLISGNYSPVLTLSQKTKVENRCKKYLNLDIVYHHDGVLSLEMTFIKDKDEIIKKLLSYDHQII